MTLYAGEQARLCHTATRDKVALTPGDGVTAHVSVYTKDFASIVVAETAMSWVAGKGRWEFLWDTTDVEPGTYRVRVRLEGLDGHSVWEYGRVALKRDPLAA